MLRYKPPAYRPPAFRPGAHRSGKLGAAPLTEKVVIGTAAGTVVFAGISTWVGINTGLNEKGLLSVAGWIVAAGSGLYAGFMIAQLIGALGKGGGTVSAPGFPR